MRISTASLDPASPLAQRINAAMARDAASRANHAPTIRPTGGTAPETWRSEDDLHRAVVRMIAAEANAAVIVFHVPNGGRRGKAEAGKFKALGVLAGIPDLVVIVGGKAHGLELKTDKGRLSREQKAMAERFRRAGAEYEVARSVAGARAILRRWGAISPTPPASNSLTEMHP